MRLWKDREPSTRCLSTVRIDELYPTHGILRQWHESALPFCLPMIVESVFLEVPLYDINGLLVGRDGLYFGSFWNILHC